MNNPPPPQATITIAILTAIAGSLIFLRHFNGIFKQIRQILGAYHRSITLRNEKHQLEIQEQRLRTAYWMSKIRKGEALQQLDWLDERIKDNQ